MILTVGSTKGGVGKSALAVQLALSWARAGRDVLLVDGDRQGSAQKCIAFRAEAERKPHMVCVQYADGGVQRIRCGYRRGAIRTSSSMPAGMTARRCGTAAV